MRADGREHARASKQKFRQKACKCARATCSNRARRGERARERACRGGGGDDDRAATAVRETSDTPSARVRARARARNERRELFKNIHKRAAPPVGGLLVRDSAVVAAAAVGPQHAHIHKSGRNTDQRVSSTPDKFAYAKRARRRQLACARSQRRACRRRLIYAPICCENLDDGDGESECKRVRARVRTRSGASILAHAQTRLRSRFFVLFSAVALIRDFCAAPLSSDEMAAALEIAH